MTASPQTQASAYVAAIAALSEAIRSLGTVPSGHLYAAVMGSCDIHQYESMIGVLTRAGLIEVRNDEIRWIGPDIADVANVGEEFIKCADCGADTPESNTVVVGDFFGSVRVCRGCAEERA